MSRILVPPDTIMTAAETRKRALRDRSLIGRVDALRDLGIDPNVAQVLDVQPGEPIHTVTVVHDPASESAA
jgi:hypothetical protein